MEFMLRPMLVWLRITVHPLVSRYSLSELAPTLLAAGLRVITPHDIFHAELATALEHPVVKYRCKSANPRDRVPENGVTSRRQNWVASSSLTRDTQCA
jgi:hypothetical protein